MSANGYIRWHGNFQVIALRRDGTTGYPNPGERLDNFMRENSPAPRPVGESPPDFRDNH